jgi:hypothetical protein
VEEKECYSHKKAVDSKHIHDDFDFLQIEEVDKHLIDFGYDFEDC